MDGYGSARVGVVDCPPESRAAGQGEIQGRDLVYNNVAGDILMVGCEYALPAVLADNTPAGPCIIANDLQEYAIVRHDGDVSEPDLAGRVGHIDHVAVAAGQAAAFHREVALADFGITGHALADHDVLRRLPRKRLQSG